VPKIIDVLMLKLLDLTPSQFDSSVIPVALGLKLLPEKIGNGVYHYFIEYVHIYILESIHD